MADGEPAQAVPTIDATAVGSSSPVVAGNSESLVAALYLPLDKERLTVDDLEPKAQNQDSTVDELEPKAQNQDSPH
jgi:hypothetical protein